MPWGSTKLVLGFVFSQEARQKAWTAGTERSEDFISESVVFHPAGCLPFLLCFWFLLVFLELFCLRPLEDIWLFAFHLFSYNLRTCTA